MNETEPSADHLVRRALAAMDDAYLEAERALLEHGDTEAVSRALQGQTEPAAPLLAGAAARGASTAAQLASEVDSYLDIIERHFSQTVRLTPPPHAVVESLSQRFGPAAAELLALRLVNRPTQEPWRNAVSLGFLQRHPTPSATAALVRFAADTPVAYQRTLALEVARSSGDPALAQKITAERTRLEAAGRALPPELAVLA